MTHGLQVCAASPGRSSNQCKAANLLLLLKASILYLSTSDFVNRLQVLELTYLESKGRFEILGKKFITSILQTTLQEAIIRVKNRVEEWQSFLHNTPGGIQGVFLPPSHWGGPTPPITTLVTQMHLIRVGEVPLNVLTPHKPMQGLYRPIQAYPRMQAKSGIPPNAAGTQL